MLASTRVRGFALIERAELVGAVLLSRWHSPVGEDISSTASRCITSDRRGLGVYKSGHLVVIAPRMCVASRGAKFFVDIGQMNKHLLGDAVAPSPAFLLMQSRAAVCLVTQLSILEALSACRDSPRERLCSDAHCHLAAFIPVYCAAWLL